MLVWLLKAPGWPGDTGLAAAGPRLAFGYWPGCYRPQAGLWVVAWLLQPTGALAWPLQSSGLARGTGLAATGTRLAWVTDLASTNPSLAWGYRPGCYMPHVGLGVLAWLLQPKGGTGRAAQALSIAWGTDLAGISPRLAKGYWPGCYRPHVGLGVLAYLLQRKGGTGMAATALRVQFLAKTDTTISRGYSTYRKRLQLYPEGTVPGNNGHYYNQMIQYLAIMVTIISKQYST